MLFRKRPKTTKKTYNFYIHQLKHTKKQCLQLQFGYYFYSNGKTIVSKCVLNKVALNKCVHIRPSILASHVSKRNFLVLTGIITKFLLILVFLKHLRNLSLSIITIATSIQRCILEKIVNGF